MQNSQAELIKQLQDAIKNKQFEIAEQLAERLQKMEVATSHEDVYICNITDITWGPYNAWHYMAPVSIPGKQAGEPYSITRITPHEDHIDLGENKTLPVFIPARDTAEDICRMCNSDIGSDSYSGLFVIAHGSKPTVEEIQSATRKLEAFYQRLILHADLAYDRGQRFDISDLHRGAARYFKLGKPWLNDFRVMEPCPLCMNTIPAGAAVCTHCGAVLDEQKARQFLPKQEQPEPEAVGVSAGPTPTGRTKGAGRK